jgi:hypothetical protein
MNARGTGSVREIAALELDVSTNDSMKVQEVPNLHRPAWNVWIRRNGAKRGTLVFTVVAWRVAGAWRVLPPRLVPLRAAAERRCWCGGVIFNGHHCENGHLQERQS